MASQYLELASSQILHQKWRDVVVDIATTQSTLQDISFPESSGSHCYREFNLPGSPCYNRFIYWKSFNDQLELVELSSELNLVGNQVRIKFTNAPIIQSVNVEELPEHLVLLCATVSSVHRLILPHPRVSVASHNVVTKQFTSNSILIKLTSDMLRDSSNYYSINNQLNADVPATGVQHPISATSWLEDDSHLATFALSYPRGSILVIKFLSSNFTTWELKQTSIIGRLWSKMPALLPKSQQVDSEDAALMCTAIKHSYSTDEGHSMTDHLLFALCRDYKIRIWSTLARECVHVYNLITDQASFNQSLSTSTSSAHYRQPLAELSNHQFIMRVSRKITKNLYILVHMADPSSEFTLLEYIFVDGIHKLEQQAIISTPAWDSLIDFGLTRKYLWALTLNADNEHAVYHRNLESESGSQDSEDDQEWTQVYLSDESCEGLKQIVNVDCHGEFRDVYIDEIFWKNRFSMTTISKAISILNRGADTGISFNQQTKIQILAEAAANIIKNSVRSDLQVEAHGDDQFAMEKEAWNRFYTYCVQNHQVSNKMIGLLTTYREELTGLIKRGNFSLLIPTPSKNYYDLLGPACGLEFDSLPKSRTPPLFDSILSAICSISKVISEEEGAAIENYLQQEPAKIHELLSNFVSCWLRNGTLDMPKLVGHDSRSGRNSSAHQSQHYAQLGSCLKCIVDAIDMGVLNDSEPTDQCNQSKTPDQSTLNTSQNGNTHFHRHKSTKTFMTSNYGIACVYELLRRMFRSRLILARNLCIMLTAIDQYVVVNNQADVDGVSRSTPEPQGSVSGKRVKVPSINIDLLSKLSHDLTMSYTNARATDNLRCYATLCWVAELPIKDNADRSISLASYQALNQIVIRFKYFTQPNIKNAAAANTSLNNQSLVAKPSKSATVTASAASLHRNLLTDFLINGGAQLAQSEAKIDFSSLRRLSTSSPSTLSNSRMSHEFACAVTRFLWPKANHLCLAEYMVCSNYHEHLSHYFNMLNDWQVLSENDRFFLQAFNYLLEGRPSQAVDLFSRLWMNMTPNNLAGRFIELSSYTTPIKSAGAEASADMSIMDGSSVSLSGHEKPFEIRASMIYKYFENLIQLFKLYDCTESIVDLVNQAIMLLSGGSSYDDGQTASVAGSNENLSASGAHQLSFGRNSSLGHNRHHSTYYTQPDQQQQVEEWVNSLRTQLFKYYLDLDMTEEAYQAMVLNTDVGQRNNCLHQFIVYHCETNQWKGLLTFPYFDLRDDFVHIFEQRAAATDLLSLAKDEFKRSSCYEILYSFFIREDQLDRAASVMYEFAQRLCQEVPGIKSISKQADCLLIVLNCLRCLRIQLDEQSRRQQGDSADNEPCFQLFSASRSSPTINGTISSSMVVATSLNNHNLSISNGFGSKQNLSIGQPNLKRGYDCDPEPHSPAPSSCVASVALSTAFSPTPTPTITPTPTPLHGAHHPMMDTQQQQNQFVQSKQQATKQQVVGLRQVEIKYELTRARLRLLEKDPKANAIALSPLRVEEIIKNLVSSSMFTYALDLSVLLRAPMEPIMEGLASKYIFLSQLSPLDLARDSAIMQSLADCFLSNYTTNATANAFAYLSKAACDSPTRSPVDRLWLLIDYYLDKYDGVSHMCSDRSFVGTFANTTVLMRTVANKLLEVGYDIPASLKRRYMTRNPAELLRLLIKYDQLVEAADVCVEMLDNVMLEAPLITTGTGALRLHVAPVYMPTHLMLALIDYLNEDATNKDNVRIGAELNKKLEAYRHHMTSLSAATLSAITRY